MSSTESANFSEFERQSLARYPSCSQQHPVSVSAPSDPLFTLAGFGTANLHIGRQHSR